MLEHIREDDQIVRRILLLELRDRVLFRLSHPARPQPVSHRRVRFDDVIVTAAVCEKKLREFTEARTNLQDARESGEGEMTPQETKFLRHRSPREPITERRTSTRSEVIKIGHRELLIPQSQLASDSSQLHGAGGGTEPQP